MLRSALGLTRIGLVGRLTAPVDRRCLLAESGISLRHDLPYLDPTATRLVAEGPVRPQHVRLITAPEELVAISILRDG